MTIRFTCDLMHDDSAFRAFYVPIWPSSGNEYNGIHRQRGYLRCGIWVTYVIISDGYFGRHWVAKSFLCLSRKLDGVLRIVIFFKCLNLAIIIIVLIRARVSEVLSTKGIYIRPMRWRYLLEILCPNCLYFAVSEWGGLIRSCYLELSVPI